MSNRPPPIPPANRSGPQDKQQAGTEDKKAAPDRRVPDRREERGRHGNVKQNTHHQGYQQDR